MIKMTKSLFINFQTRKSKKKFTILDDLYDQVMQFIEYKINSNTYTEKTFVTPTDKLINGYFVYDLTRSTLQKKLTRKFVK